MEGITRHPRFDSYNMVIIRPGPIFPTTPHRWEPINFLTAVLARWGWVIPVDEQVHRQCYKNGGVWHYPAPRYFHLFSAPDPIDFLSELNAHQSGRELLFAAPLNISSGRCKRTALVPLKGYRVSYPHGGQRGSFRGGFRGHFLTLPKDARDRDVFLDRIVRRRRAR
jgi:hypothetical protein